MSDYLNTQRPLAKTSSQPVIHSFESVLLADSRMLTTPLPNLSIYGLAKLLCVAMLAVLLSACNTLPKQPHLNQSIQLTQRLQANYNTHLQPALPSNATDAEIELDKKAQLSRAIDQQSEAHPHLSGYHTIITGANAFAARSILTDRASKSIDVQYYIWHNDQAGQLLLKKLWQAADRGVIVRFLLDDFNNNAALDKHLLRFASHPNIAVRLIDPQIEYFYHYLSTHCPHCGHQ